MMQWLDGAGEMDEAAWGGADTTERGGEGADPRDSKRRPDVV